MSPVTYTVEIDPRAEQEALGAYLYIRGRSGEQRAAAWLAELYEAVAGLSLFPNGRGDAREAKAVGRPLRQLIHHSHRVIYEVDEGRAAVKVLHIRPAAMRQLPPRSVR